MTTVFTPRPNPYFGDERDWYDLTLHQMRQRLCGSDAYPTASTDGEREAAVYIGRKAIELFIYRFEPALAELPARQAHRRAERFADSLVSGTHPDDLDYEANRHYGPSEVRTVWGPKAADALAESDIDTHLAYRYGLDGAQANRLRERMGLPTAPEAEAVGSW